MDPSSYEIIHIRLIQETLPLTYKWLSIKRSISFTKAKEQLALFCTEQSTLPCISIHFVVVNEGTSGYQCLKLMYKDELLAMDPTFIVSQHVYALSPSILPDLRILHCIDQEILQTVLLPPRSTKPSTLPTKKVSPKPTSPPKPSLPLPPPPPAPLFISTETKHPVSSASRSPIKEKDHKNTYEPDQSQKTHTHKKKNLRSMASTSISTNDLPVSSKPIPAPIPNSTSPRSLQSPSSPSLSIPPPSLIG
ncbi:hypothetical protein HMI55_007345 [Coelomomyces lativittatus]|nr:hypothetical protein HMI55_007345 [Coelomomyces lativittatus]